MLFYLSTQAQISQINRNSLGSQFKQVGTLPSGNFVYAVCSVFAPSSSWNTVPPAGLTPSRTLPVCPSNEPIEC